jgi:deoxyribonuclease-4
MSKLIRRLGVHTSIAGGIHLSLERARELGCNTVQIFSHNPRQWHVGKIPHAEAKRFRQLREKYDIDPVYIHTSYLINLAALRNDILQRSITLLIREMDIADMLGADYVILHTGSASQDTEENGRKKAIEALKIVSKEKKWNAGLLLENTVGERGDISSRMKDLSGIIEGVNSNIIGGVCIDTCHAFAAGYDIKSKNGIEGLADEIKRFLGIESVKLIHLNDSKKGCNSHVDRHEHIGEGGIGKKGLQKFINHPAFKNIPLILETPKKSEEDDPGNLKIVRSLL